MIIKARIKKLESEICPKDVKFGVLLCTYDRNLTGKNIYMKNDKVVGRIPSVLEWANGKLARMISSESEEGQKILKELGYEIVSNP